MIDDLIGSVHAAGLVDGVVLEPDGCDAYVRGAVPQPITLRVCPDGRFSRAVAGGELLSLGQVRARLATVRARPAPDRNGLSRRASGGGVNLAQ